jgi:hypothetical protein
VIRDLPDRVRIGENLVQGGVQLVDDRCRGGGGCEQRVPLGDLDTVDAGLAQGGHARELGQPVRAGDGEGP